MFSIVLGLGIVAAGRAAADESAGNLALQDVVSYTNDIRPVVKSFCLNCHAGEEPEADMLLTSYELVREETELGYLLERINDAHEPMPEDGLMPSPMRRLFQQWADSGYVNVGAERPAAEREIEEFVAPDLQPVDLRDEGFDLLERLQGHWVGSMNLMGRKYDWMTFDYRAIAPSHVHGIFEGGTVGNLFTSFFVTDFKGRPTIMARNGGLLNGIYRTSYFVLTDVKRGWRTTGYELVDAHGGKDVMSMKLEFAGDDLTFTAYTSRMGLRAPTRHMRFVGERTQPQLAQQAATAVGFPQQVSDFPMPDPLPRPTWTEDYPMTSASYVCETPEEPVGLDELGRMALDPRRIDQMPHLSQLKISLHRSRVARGQPVQLYLSTAAITDEDGNLHLSYGYPDEERFNSIVLFPRLHGGADHFTFTYLHPGEYYLTVFTDADEDGVPNSSDAVHPSFKVAVAPEALIELEPLRL